MGRLSVTLALRQLCDLWCHQSLTNLLRIGKGTPLEEAYIKGQWDAPHNNAQHYWIQKFPWSNPLRENRIAPAATPTSSPGDIPYRVMIKLLLEQVHPIVVQTLPGSYWWKPRGGNQLGSSAKALQVCRLRRLHSWLESANRALWWNDCLCLAHRVKHRLSGGVSRGTWAIQEWGGKVQLVRWPAKLWIWYNGVLSKSLEAGSMRFPLCHAVG